MRFRCATLLLVGLLVVVTVPAAANGAGGYIVGWGRNNHGQASPPAGEDFVAIAGGRHHSVALRADGSLVAWGRDQYGQVSGAPAGNDFAAVSAGSDYAVALRADGSVAAWGRDQYGQVSGAPAGNDFVAIAAGSNHGLALRADGSIVGWGSNFSGEASPPAGNDFAAISAGGGHSLALRADGSLVGWGDDDFGEASPPAGNDFAAISAGGGHSLALRSDGSLVSWGDDAVYQVWGTPAGTGFAAIATGFYHSLALHSDGSLVGWGDDSDGQASPPASHDYLAVAAGWEHSLALVAPGPPSAFGKVAPADEAAHLGSVVSISWQATLGAAGYEYCADTTDDGACAPWVDAGTETSAGLTGLADATTYLWQVRARNGHGLTEADGGDWWEFTTGPPPAFGKVVPADGAAGLSNRPTLFWQAAPGADSYEYCLDASDDDLCAGWLEAGTATSVTLGGLADDTTYFWQARAVNGWGQTEADGGDWWSFTTRPAGAPIAGGSITHWGSRPGNVPPPGGFDFVAVAGGQAHSLALREDGSLVSWGQDYSGEVSGTPPGTGFVAISAAGNHSLALRADGSLVGWGDDYFGQASPPAGTDFVAVDAGWDHGLALRADGSLAAWGWDFYDQVSGAPPGSDFVAVSGGGGHSLALRSDGSIAAWGWDGDGQVSGTPAGNDFVAVAAGLHHSLALRADGSIAAWGDDSYGQVSGTPAGKDFVAVAAGLYHSLALRADGSIAAWGDDSYGQVSGTPAGNRLIALAAGTWHSLAVAAGPPDGFSKASPEDGAEGQGPDPALSWTAAPGASSYEYCVDATDDDACSGWASAGADTGVALSGLAGGTTYFWQVRAVNGWGSTEADGGAWWSFTTGPPGAFGKVTPPDGAAGQPIDPILSWGAAPGAARYEYCADTADDGACAAWVDAGAATEAGPTALAYETAYFWQVRAVNAFGATEADGGDWWRFTTKPTPEIEQASFRSVGGNDGWVLESDTASGKGSNQRDAAGTSARVGDDAADRQYRSILDFDTRSLPDDAVVTAVILRIRRAGTDGIDPLTTHGLLQVDIRTGAFHHEPTLERYDFHALGSRGRVGRFVAAPPDDWYRATLRPVAYPLVNLTGRTQFRLRFFLGDDGDGVADYLSFFTGDALVAVDRPELIVRYYVP